MSKGRFIVIEGLDGSGKTSVIERLVEILKIHTFVKPFVTEEPTKALSIGKYIRRYMKNTKGRKHSLLVEALLFFADRYDHLDKIINPWLDKGYLVISDRYWYSTIAYQGAQTSRDMQEDNIIPWLYNLMQFTTTPDYAFYLDVSLDTAFERLKSGHRRLTIFEDREMLERVKVWYEKMVDQKLLISVDGEMSVNEIATTIFRIIMKDE